MSKCKFCGKDAGLLRSIHKECQQRHDTGEQQIRDILFAAASGSIGLENAERDIKRIAKDAYIEPTGLQSLTLPAFEEAITKALSDDLLTRDEEEVLNRYIQYFQLQLETLSTNDTYLRLVKAGVLRDIVEGSTPERVKINGTLPFNFQKSEQLVWLFQDVEYMQPRTHTSYQGRSSGVSLRVMKGVYYRVGEFKGNPIVNTHIATLDTGLLAVTTKHLYFAGQAKSLRIRYDKIVSFMPYSDAIGVQRDSVSKPDLFKTGDGWFTYNLVMNLAKE